MSEFDVETFFKNTKNRDVLENNLWVLERLCKKIDVVGKVYKKYTDDMSHCLEKEEVSNECLYEIRSAMLFSAKNKSDLKFVNTLLKLDELMVKVGALSHQQLEKNKAQLSTMFFEFTQTADGV